MPSPLWVPSGVRCTALTLTCTTLGPTSEATRATGSSAGMREDEADEACDEAFGEALAAFSPCDVGCSCEQPPSSTTASKAAHALFLQLNVPEPPVGARSASFATESI